VVADRLASVGVDRRGVPDAGRTLAQAFHDDPLWGALWPEPRRRADVSQRMFTALVATTLAAGAPARRTPDGSAVALWNQPGTRLGAWATLRSGLALPRMVARLSRQERESLLSTLSFLERRHRALEPRPHWYLAAIGVHPSRQGEGIGSALVREGIRRAAAARTAVYLETETSANVRFYSALGFSVLEEHVLPALGVPIWLMRATPGR
jgi:ribosomal protein S18 acetylase RimI-like enzyme